MDSKGAEISWLAMLNSFKNQSSYGTNHNAGTASKLATFVTLTLDTNNVALFPGYTSISHFSVQKILQGHCLVQACSLHSGQVLTDQVLLEAQICTESLKVVVCKVKSFICTTNKQRPTPMQIDNLYHFQGMTKTFYATAANAIACVGHYIPRQMLTTLHTQTLAFIL